MPNLISREYCHAQQDSRSAFTPETFLKMAMVSALTGPLDMANGNFGIKSINAGEREKGPRKKNSYISTVVSEVARTLVIYCKAGCWMSWNAAKRAIAYGYSNVLWFPDGTDAWAAAGLPTEPSEPVAGWVPE